MNIPESVVCLGMIILEIMHILVSKNGRLTLKKTSTISGAVPLCFVASAPTAAATRSQMVTWIYSVYGSVRLKIEFFPFSEGERTMHNQRHPEKYSLNDPWASWWMRQPSEPASRCERPHRRSLYTYRSKSKGHLSIFYQTNVMTYLVAWLSANHSKFTRYTIWCQSENIFDKG